MITRMSSNGLKQLADREGVRTRAYRDTRGIWTIGVGHTSAAGPPNVYDGLVLSQDQVMDLFAKDVSQYETAVARAIKVDLSQNQFDALVSICYNIGVGAFASSSMVRDINTGASDNVIDNDIMKWNKPEEILGRRQSERDEFDSKG